METLKELATFFNNHALWSGVVIGIVIGFLPSVYAGHLGNVYTETKKKRTLEGKQQQFIARLGSATEGYVTAPPTTEVELVERRKDIAAQVKRLSQEIFDQDSPQIISIRPEITEYPLLPCKWCHRQHKAFAGSKGECTNCHLPLDFWIGCQGETHSDKFRPSD